MLPSVQAFDVASVKIGAQQKTVVIYYVLGVDAALLGRKICEVRLLASVDTAVRGNVPLRVAVGLRRCVKDQFLAKADVIRAMRERVQLCQDPQTEFALLRESLGVSRINHIFRVHGHTILNEEAGAKIFEEVGQRPL